MKVFYTCDYCGKRYNSEADCLACEELHREEQVRREKLLKEKQARSAEIREKHKELISLISAFNKDYQEPADIPFSGTLDKVLNSLLNTF